MIDHLKQRGKSGDAHVTELLRLLLFLFLLTSRWSIGATALV